MTRLINACSNTGFHQMCRLELTIFSEPNVMVIMNIRCQKTCLMFSAKSAPMPIVELPRKPLGQVLHLKPGCRLVQVVWGEHGKYKHWKDKHKKNKTLSAEYLQTLISCKGHSIKWPFLSVKFFDKLLLLLTILVWLKANLNPWELSLVL